MVPAKKAVKGRLARNVITSLMEDHVLNAEAVVSTKRRVNMIVVI
jgi:hypothetical protein